MSASKPLERRGAARILKQLPLDVGHADGEFQTITRDLSTSGVYCTVSHFLAPMTKLRIRLKLSSPGAAEMVSCEGIVVRIQPPAATPRRSHYDVAILFHDLSERSRLALSQYIQHHLHSPA